MLTFRRLHELLDFEAGGAEVVSVYLEIDRSNPPGAYRAMLQDSRARHAALSELAKDLERVERFVGELPPGAHRGLAVFSAEGSGLWEAILLPQPVKSLLVVDRRPYLVPLSSVLDQHQRFGVCLLDPSGEKYLEVYLGQVEDCLPGPVPTRGRASSTPAPGDEPHPRLRRVAAQTAAIARRRGWDRVILGAPRELETLLMGHLPLSLKQNLILDPSLALGMPDRDVLDRVLANEREARKVRESVLVHRLADAVNAGGPAVLGLEPTVDALRRGLVRLLLVRDGFTKLGRSCQSCGRLSVSEKKCGACGHPTAQVFDLIGELVQEALDQGCEVFRVLHEPRLAGLGSIGAELAHRPPTGREGARAGGRKRLSIPL